MSPSDDFNIKNQLQVKYFARTHPCSAYFLVCNADRHKENFNQVMTFEESLVPYDWNAGWIEAEVDAMVALMNQHQIPEPNESCKNCAYADQYARAVHGGGNGESKPVQRRLFF